MDVFSGAQFRLEHLTLVGDFVGSGGQCLICAILYGVLKLDHGLQEDGLALVGCLLYPALFHPIPNGGFAYVELVGGLFDGDGFQGGSVGGWGVIGGLTGGMGVGFRGKFFSNETPR